MYQEDGIWDAELFPDNRPQKPRRELGPTWSKGNFLGYTVKKGAFRARRCKEPIRVWGTHRISRRPRGVGLYQKVSYLCVRSCNHLLEFQTGFRIFIPSIGLIPWQASHPNWGGPWKAGPGLKNGAGKRDSMGSHPERSETGPEKGRRSHSNHPEKSSLEYRILYKKNGVRSTGVNHLN